MSKVTGRAYIDVPGFGRLSTEEGSELNTGGFEREDVVSDIEVEGYTEKPAVPMITCSIIHRQGLDILALNKLTDINVPFETDSGSAYILRGAWTSKPCTLNKGRVSLELHGKGCDAVKI